MHYYFRTREELYGSLLTEAHVVVADCIAQASREDNLLKRLSVFVAAAHRADSPDRSMARFIVVCLLECERHPRLRQRGSPVVAAMRAFYESTVTCAIERRELPADTDTGVVELLVAMVWGIGFYAGFVDRNAEMKMVAKQFNRLLAHGLLDRPSRGRPQTVDPDAPAAVASNECGRTWPGLTLTIDVHR
jgi:AcrR family transcriptional regulator